MYKQEVCLLVPSDFLNHIFIPRLLARWLEAPKFLRDSCASILTGTSIKSSAKEP